MGRATEAEQAFEEEIRLFPKNREAYARYTALLTLEGTKRTQTARSMV